MEDVPSEDSANVAALYEEAGVVLGNSVVRRLQEVEAFHSELITNRRAFLATEVQRIEQTILEREEQIQTLSERRASTMEILSSHGALDDFNQLERKNAETRSKLAELQFSISRINELEQGSSKLKVDQEILYQRARRNYEERKAERERALLLFNASTEALYEVPGNLVIDIKPSGYRFDVEIERSGSQGIESMKVFCYDVTVSQFWAENEAGPGFLVHDSALFDGVDSRQVALALERAADLSERQGFQYICTLNSDDVPTEEFSSEFDLESYVVRRLTDLRPDGRLLGTAFDPKKKAKGATRSERSQAEYQSTTVRCNCRCL